MSDEYGDEQKRKEQARKEMAYNDARQIVLDFVQESRSEVDAKAIHSENLFRALERIVSGEERFVREIKEHRAATSEQYQEMLKIATQEQKNNERAYAGWLKNNERIRSLDSSVKSLERAVATYREILPKCPTCGFGLMQFASDGRLIKCLNSICPTNQKPKEEEKADVIKKPHM